MIGALQAARPWSGAERVVTTGVDRQLRAGMLGWRLTMTDVSLAGDLAALVAATAAGDKAAFQRLYELQSPRLYGLALRMTRDAGMAADALHDAMLQAWAKAGRYDPSLGPVEAWLVGLLRFRAIDLIRRYGRERPGLELEEDADPEPDPLARLEASEAGSALRRCLDLLDERHRRVVLLSFMQGLSHTELAERLTAPLGTVKSWIRRGLLTLRECLGG